MTLDTILTSLLDNVVNILPMKIVHTYEQGVYYKQGKDVKLLRPGIHFHRPIIDGIEKISTVPQTIYLPTQSILTKDGEAVSVSSNLEYKIHNARKVWTKVQDLDSSLHNTGMGYLSRFVRGYNYNVLARSTGKLEEEVLDNLNEKVNPWGVTVKEFYVTDFVKAKQYRLFGDPTLR